MQETNLAEEHLLGRNSSKDGEAQLVCLANNDTQESPCYMVKLSFLSIWDLKWGQHCLIDRSCGPCHAYRVTTRAHPGPLFAPR